MALAPGSTPPVLLVAFTTDVGLATLQGLSPSGYSFISVDAGHLAADVAHDLAMIEPLTGERTVVAADDVFNPKTPGVMEGLCRHFIARPDSVLAPFAWAGNKLFLCHRATHPTLLAYVHGLLNNAATPSYIVKTRAGRAQNHALAFVPSLFGHEILAFEWM